MEESRKQFIEFAKKEGLDLQTGYSGYVNLTTQLALRAWDISRAAIEINIPPAMGDHQIQWDGTDWNMMREHAVNSIRAAGLKIKGG